MRGILIKIINCLKVSEEEPYKKDGWKLAKMQIPHRKLSDGTRSNGIDHIVKRWDPSLKKWELKQVPESEDELMMRQW